MKQNKILVFSALIIFFSIGLFASEQNNSIVIKYLNGKQKISYDNGFTWKDQSQIIINRANIQKHSTDGGFNWNYIRNEVKEQYNSESGYQKSTLTRVIVYTAQLQMLFDRKMELEDNSLRSVERILSNYWKGNYIILFVNQDNNLIYKISK